MPEPQTAGDHEPTCDLSVVVPVYKEEANIAPFLERMESVLASARAKHLLRRPRRA